MANISPKLLFFKHFFSKKTLANRGFARYVIGVKNTPFRQGGEASQKNMESQTVMIYDKIENLSRYAECFPCADKVIAFLE